jgi:hypothetical protein
VLGQHGMRNIRLTLAACLIAFITGCTSSSKVGEVQDLGGGSYSIAMGSAGIGGVSQTADAVKVTVDKAGAYCHAKGLKLVVTQAAGKDISFRCVSDTSITAPTKAQ